MAQQVFINLPVSDVAASTDFYTALGFKINEAFSDENASCMVWSEQVLVMLLHRDYFATFTNGKPVIDTKASAGVLVALGLDTKQAVQDFADTAKANGGDYFTINTDIPEDMMFGYEVLDPNGNQWEPVWMNPEAGTER